MGTSSLAFTNSLNEFYAIKPDDSIILLRDLPDDSQYEYRTYLTHEQTQQLLEKKKTHGDFLKLAKLTLISNGMSLGPAGFLAGAMMAADIYNLEQADRGNGVEIWVLNNQEAMILYKPRP